MAFKDWEETEASNPLVLPIRGNHYRIPALGHLDAIAIREDFNRVKNGEPPSMGNEEFMTAVLSPELLTRMRADNVPEAAIVHAAVVAQTDAQLGRDAAEDMWERGPSPETLAAALKLAMKQPAANASSTISPATPPRARTSSTKKPANTASTKPRPRKQAAPRSRGQRSSTTRD